MPVMLLLTRLYTSDKILKVSLIILKIIYVMLVTAAYRNTTEVQYKITYTEPTLHLTMVA